MAYETAYLELKDDLDTRVITDMHDLAVAEKGKPAGLATRMECALVLAFARMKVRQKAGLRPDPVPEQDKIFDKYHRIPSSLAFWTTAIIHSPQIERASIRSWLWRLRDERGIYTVLDQ